MLDVHDKLDEEHGAVEADGVPVEGVVLALRQLPHLSLVRLDVRRITLRFANELEETE